MAKPWAAAMDVELTCQHRVESQGLAKEALVIQRLAHATYQVSVAIARSSGRAILTPYCESSLRAVCADQFLET